MKNSLLKKNIEYSVLIFISFSLVWHEYGIKTALLGFVLLASMFFLLLNSVKAYQRSKQKQYNEAALNFISIIIFYVIIYFLPDRLTRFATAFCVILFVFYIIYDIVKTGRSKE